MVDYSVPGVFGHPVRSSVGPFLNTACGTILRGLNTSLYLGPITIVEAHGAFPGRQMSANQAILPIAHQLKDAGKSTKSVLTSNGSRWLKPRPIGGLLFMLIVWYALTNSPLKFGDEKTSMQLQPKGPPFSSTQLDRQSQIRELFFRMYRKYMKPSWRRADALPLATKHSLDGEGAAVLDSLPTLYIMNLREEFDIALNQTINMDFQISNVEDLATPTPEIIIRSLGAILSAYELLGANQTKILHKAQEMGEHLQTSWNFNQSAVPYPWLYFGLNQKDMNNTITIAQAGALSLEFNRLSHWTGKNSYRARADETSGHIMNNPPAFPGRHSSTSTPSNGPPVSEIVSWGAKLNSFLEYGIKYWQLAGEPATYYMKYWQDSVDVLIEHLLQWSPGKNQPYLAGYSLARGGHQSDMSQLACFASGNWMLGGKLLQNEAIFMLGLGMAETCYQSDSSFREGGEYDKYNQAVDTVPFLRAEIAEIIWYAWRLTGDSVWQDRAWSMFEATSGRFERIHLKDSSLEKYNSIDISLIGQYFKYLYLTFTERDYYSLDEWVFSQGHPFRLDPNQNLGNLRDFIEKTKT